MKYAIVFDLPSDILAEHPDEFPTGTEGYAVGPFDTLHDALFHLYTMQENGDQDCLFGSVVAWRKLRRPKH